MAQSLSPRLKSLVHESVALLGEVLRRELGEAAYRRIERWRREMVKLRGRSPEKARPVLEKLLREMARLSPEQRLAAARAYTLMLELMNACENAHRSGEIRRRPAISPGAVPDSIIYVLTAHPTESRAPENIWIFHDLLLRLTARLEKIPQPMSDGEREGLLHDLQVAWRLPVVRGRKPRVQDEAEHIYSTLLRDESLRTLLAFGREVAPVYVRSWVGGDKDGHPGVDETAFHDSLELSRRELSRFVRRRFNEVREVLARDPLPAVRAALVAAERELAGLAKIRAGDGGRIERFRRRFETLCREYRRGFHALHSSLLDARGVLHVCPGLVVTLEFRESSDVLMASPGGRGLAIFRMLKALGSFARGGDPRWYVRGFIISMASRLEHLQTAADLVEKALGELRLPVVPLFEQYEAMQDGPRVVGEMLRDRRLSKALRTRWNSRLEIMLGYSDSSKESGVLQSRLEIAETMFKLDRLCRRHRVTPIFFQGSGGSVDRGGGSVQDQTAWWSSGALRNYKVTIQGEMVERSLANAEITRGQLERIAQSAGRWKQAQHRSLRADPALDAFAARAAEAYRQQVASPDFLRLIEKATPYPFLNLIKIGSRPSKRSKTLSVQGLRAIPWILCWTQTRLLFPTWWGVGTAWKTATPSEHRALKRAMATQPLFASYVKALGFTLAKIEPAVWDVYLSRSGLPRELIDGFRRELAAELRHTRGFARAMLGTAALLPSKPWLQESITLRSPMIHPLNLLQILAMEKGEVDLLRLSVAGIASGMMTTG